MDDEADIIIIRKEASEKQNRIAELEEQREQELQSRKWMSSCPERKHSYGQYPIFEKKVNEKFDKMISVLQRDVNTLLQSITNNNEPISPDSSEAARSGNSRTEIQAHRRPNNKKRSRRGRYKNDIDEESSYDDSDSDYSADESDSYNNKKMEQEEEEEDDERSIESKFSYVSKKSSDDKEQSSDDSSESSDESGTESSPPTRNKCNNDGQGVIDLAGSSDSSSSSEEDYDESIAGKSKEDDDESSSIHAMNEEDDVVFDNNEGGALDSNLDSTSNNDTLNGNDTSWFQPDYNHSDEEEVDDDDSDGGIEEIKHYHISKIKQSKLAMVAQGFRCQATNKRSINDANDEESVDANRSSSTRETDHTPFDPSSVEYRGKNFQQNRCYVLKLRDGDAIVGIKYFVSEDTAHCILVAPFGDTFLGTEETEVDYTADYLMNEYVQVYNFSADLSLSKLVRESEDVELIPRLIYQSRTKGDWNTFGYFINPKLMRRKGKCRTASITSLEGFVGAGGSLQGYENNGFDTVIAIDNDSDAIATLKLNNPKVKVYEGDIKQFMKDYKCIKCVLGKIDHIHWSSPCQPFSQANRSQNGSQIRSQKCLDQAELSPLLVDFVRMTNCSTAVFENVVGIYQRKNVHYLKNTRGKRSRSSTHTLSIKRYDAQE